MKNATRLLLLLLLCPGTAIQADPWQFDGHIKYQISVTSYKNNDLFHTFGEDPASDQDIDLRLKAGKRWSQWDTQIHYQLLAVAGDTVESRRVLAPLLPAFASRSLLSDDSRRWFDLTKVVHDSSNAFAVQRLDRLAIGYSSEKWVGRLGRQTVSWGNGLLFHPLDVFNPFSPTTIDKSYKSGDDMLYAQRLFNNGNDLQMVLIPRRDPLTGDVDSKQGSLALKYHGNAKDIEFDVLLARHFDQPILGLGFSGNIAGAVWRLDFSLTELDDGDTTKALVFNMDRSWTVRKKNIRGFFEYFRNDLGDKDQRYNMLDPELQVRLQRGEVFTLARDYLALGVQVEWTPRLNSFSNWIRNLNDDSNLLQVYLTFDWKQNLALWAGVTLKQGDRGSEYGGIVVNSNKVLGTGDTAFLRLFFFF